MTTTLDQWQPFFAAVAGVAATLVGLLFVGLSLNPSIMADRGPTGLRMWAGETFHSFLAVLAFALIGLIPNPGVVGFSLPLLVVGGLGIARILGGARRIRRDGAPDWGWRTFAVRFAAPLVGYAVAIWVGVDVLRGEPGQIGWLVATVFLLMMNATGNCWDLLREIGDRSGS